MSTCYYTQPSISNIQLVFPSDRPTCDIFVSSNTSNATHKKVDRLVNDFGIVLLSNRIPTRNAKCRRLCDLFPLVCNPLVVYPSYDPGPGLSNSTPLFWLTKSIINNSASPSFNLFGVVQSFSSAKSTGLENGIILHPHPHVYDIFVGIRP